MSDLTAIEQEGEFAKCISDYIKDNRPERIIETGLYHGNGSTKIICKSIKDLSMEEAEFYSIECNEANIEIASKNLAREGLNEYVEILHGISIPKRLLPSSQDIIDTILKAKENGVVKLDHEQDPDNGYVYYERETSNFIEDDLLGKLLLRLSGQVDFVLLDSGGHIGNIEFNHAIGLIKSPCAIALDDTKHIKHYRCLEFMKKDGRFRVLKENQEKFGSALAIFNP